MGSSRGLRLDSEDPSPRQAAKRALTPRSHSCRLVRICRSIFQNVELKVSHIGARLSMDGKRCWLDNFFVEPLWRSVRYEDVYLKTYDSIGAATFAWVPDLNYPELSLR